MSTHVVGPSKKTAFEDKIAPLDSQKQYMWLDDLK